MSRLSPALEDDLAISILTRMARIWAAFDSQATAARARRSMTRPMGWLIVGDAVRMSASTLVTVFQPVSIALRAFVGGYRTSEHGIGLNKLKSRLAAVMDIRAKATTHVDHLERGQGSFALDAVLKDVAIRSAQSDDPFLDQIRKHKTDTAFGDLQMSQFW